MKKNFEKNDINTIARLLSDMYSILSKGDWCVCITLFNGKECCGKVLKQNDTTNPYRAFIVLLNENGQHIHINLVDVKQIKKYLK